MINFPGQREGEKVEKVIRKHPIVYMRIIFMFIAVVAIPLALLYSFWTDYYPSTQYPDLNIFVTIFALLYFLYGFLLLCIAWIDEAFDLFILTDERLMDFTQISLLKSTVSSTPLEHIQDTTSIISGMIPTLLNYGDVEVQTASAQSTTFHLDKTPDPSMVARIILNAAKETRSRLGKKSDTQDVDR
jgi:hypothetical protein